MNHPLMQKFLFIAAAILSGWVAAFSMSPVSFWQCLFAGLSALYWLYSKTEKPIQTFAAGFFFGIGYFVTGLWWIGNALLVEGNEFAWVWPISVIGLPSLLSLFTGTFLALARMVAPANTWKGFAAFCFLLMMSEWTRGNAFTGFPWNLYGYVWAESLPMAQMAHYIGAYGMTLVSIAWAALGGFLIVAKPARRTVMVSIAVAALTMAAAFLMGEQRLNNNPTTFDRDNAVVVAQPNIAQDMKWNSEKLQNNFLKIVSLSRNARFTAPAPKNVFIVWPETAISPTIYTNPENMDRMESLLRSYKDQNAFLVTGVLRRLEDPNGEIGYANSVVFLNNEMQALSAYDKYHLVPFGEFIPLQNWIPLKPVAAFKGFHRGTGAATIQTTGIPAFSPLICYEVIFPDQVTPLEGIRPRWIVNVTNDGWYGDSAGPHQHFAQTRLRAIEEGLPIVRAANTGISGIIDPFGRVIEQADIFEEAAIAANLPEPVENKNPFWPWVLQPLYGLAALVILGRLLLLRLRA